MGRSPQSDECVSERPAIWTCERGCKHQHKSSLTVAEFWATACTDVKSACRACSNKIPSNAIFCLVLSCCSRSESTPARVAWQVYAPARGALACNGPSAGSSLWGQQLCARSQAGILACNWCLPRVSDPCFSPCFHCSLLPLPGVVTVAQIVLLANKARHRPHHCAVECDLPSQQSVSALLMHPKGYRL
jgi:hypothetical protein